MEKRKMNIDKIIQSDSVDDEYMTIYIKITIPSN